MITVHLSDCIRNGVKGDRVSVLQHHHREAKALAGDFGVVYKDERRKDKQFGPTTKG